MEDRRTIGKEDRSERRTKGLKTEKQRDKDPYIQKDYKAGHKKSRYFAVRLTISVYPPSPLQSAFCEISF